MATSRIRPPYHDTVTGQRLDTNDPQCEGWLTKQSMWLKDWRRRYFILKGSRLFFARSETAAPHGLIDLSNCMTVKSAEMKVRKKNAIEVSTVDTTYFMYADTEKDKDDWIGAIGRAIVQASSTFQHEEQQEEEGSDDDEETEYNYGK